MADVSIDHIKELRERTQASLADCRQALEETGGNIDEAMKELRAKGASVAEKRGDREAAAGRVEAYVHGEGSIGVLVEVRSETDFVARSPEFQELAHELALHVAASAPRYVREEEIPDEVKDEERELIKKQFQDAGKPEDVMAKIVEGKLAARAKELCLLEQPFVKDPDKTVQDVLDEAMAKFGEKVTVTRFARFEV